MHGRRLGYPSNVTNRGSSPRKSDRTQTRVMCARLDSEVSLSRRLDSAATLDPVLETTEIVDVCVAHVFQRLAT